MNAKGLLKIAMYLTLTPVAMAADPPDSPAPLPPEGGPAAVPLSEAKDLTSEVLRYKDRLIMIQRPKQLLTRSVAACVPGKTMRVWWDAMYVCRTPDDAGSYEEWRSWFSAGTNWKYVSWTASFSPPDRLNLSTDNYSACWRYTANKKGYFNEIPADIAYIFQQTGGSESDTWPDPDDKIPGFIGVQSMDNCAGNFVWMTDCGWNPDYKRYSCIVTQFYTY